MDSKKREISTTFISNIVSSIGSSINNFVLVKHYGKYSIDLEDARNVQQRPTRNKEESINNEQCNN